MTLTKFNNPIKSITSSGERDIEIAYAKEFHKIKAGKICEIGAVLRHWGVNTKHETIDWSERGPGVRNEDATKLNYENKNVVCISTIEHMGYTEVHKSFEFGNKDREGPINFLNKIKEQSKSFLITWPIGYCKTLDEYFFDNLSEFNFFLYRTQHLLPRSTSVHQNEWTLVKDHSIWKKMEYKIGNRFSVINGVVVVYKI